MPAFEETQSAFDQLRIAIEGRDANLFPPLQVALSDLIKMGRSLEVYIVCSMWCLLMTSLSQDRFNAKQQFSVLETRVRGFRAIACASTATAAAASDEKLQKLLRAIGVCVVAVLRILLTYIFIRVVLFAADILVSNAKDMTRSQPQQPVQEFDEIKYLLQLHMLLLKPFLVAIAHLLDRLIGLIAARRLMTNSPPKKD